MQKRTKKIVAGVLILATLLSYPLYMLGTEREARQVAQEIADTLAYRFGLNVRNTYNYGFLYKRQSSSFSVTLYRGVTYYIVAGGCSSAYDVDLFLYDGYQNLVRRDRNSAKFAIVEATPSVGGRFYVKVRMYDCTDNGAHWVVMYAYK